MRICSHGCDGHYSRVNHFNNVAVRRQTPKYSIKPSAASFYPQKKRRKIDPFNSL